MGGQNVPGGPPKHIHRAAAAKPQASKTWLHPQNAKMHTHMRPHTGRGRALPSQPQNSLGHSACRSSSAWQHTHQLLCSSKPQDEVQVPVPILRQEKGGKLWEERRGPRVGM